MNDEYEIVGISTNIAPITELEVQTTTSQYIFNTLSKGNPFATGIDEPCSPSTCRCNH